MGVCESQEDGDDRATDELNEEASKHASFMQAVKTMKFQDAAAILNPKPKDFDINRRDTTDKKQMSALHHACANGDERMVKMLIREGSDVNAVTKTFNELPTKRGGWTPLMVAARNGHFNVMKQLFDAMPYPDEQLTDAAGQTVLHHAAMCIKHPESFSDIVELLSVEGHIVDPSKADTFRRTALHTAAEYGHEAAVQTLLDKGCDKEDKDHKEKTAYDYAADAVAGTYTQRVQDDVINPAAQQEAYQCIEDMLLAKQIQ